MRLGTFQLVRLPMSQLLMVVKVKLWSIGRTFADVFEVGR